MSVSEASTPDLRGQGPAVVFLHGLTFDRSTWAPIVDRLAPQAQCLSVDLPAHGQTGGLPLPMVSVAAGVNGVVEHLGLERPVVVGHSMGAGVATVYARAFPAAGVVNVDQPLNMRPFTELVQRIEPALRGDGFAAAFAPFEASMGIGRIPEPLRSAVLAAQDIRPEVVVGYWEEALGQTPDEMQALVDQTLDALHQPYLALFGRRLEEAERTRLRQHISHLELEEWPDAGHFLHLVEPGRFLDRLRSFIASCLVPDPPASVGPGSSRWPRVPVLRPRPPRGAGVLQPGAGDVVRHPTRRHRRHPGRSGHLLVQGHNTAAC